MEIFLFGGHLKTMSIKVEFFDVFPPKTCDLQNLRENLALPILQVTTTLKERHHK